MAVKIRMMRLGRRHRPFFRINAIESTNPRNGKILEKLGHYDPIEKDKEKQIVMNLDRIKYWIGQGAIPSETVANMLRPHGITSKVTEEKKARVNKARQIAHKKGKLFAKADRAAAEKAAAEAAEKVKAEAEAAEKAKAEAAKAAAEAAEKVKAEAEAAEKAEAEKAAKAAEEAAKPEATEEKAEDKSDKKDEQAQ